jgi:hypothetical protein
LAPEEGSQTLKAKAPGHHSRASGVNQWYVRHDLPNHLYDLLVRASCQAYFGEPHAGGGGVEPQQSDAPLTDLANRVQYPLATPSKHDLSSTPYKTEVALDCDIHHKVKIFLCQIEKTPQNPVGVVVA